MINRFYTFFCQGEKYIYSKVLPIRNFHCIMCTCIQVELSIILCVHVYLYYQKAFCLIFWMNKLLLSSTSIAVIIVGWHAILSLARSLFGMLYESGCTLRHYQLRYIWIQIPCQVLHGMEQYIFFGQFAKNTKILATKKKKEFRCFQGWQNHWPPQNHHLGVVELLFLANEWPNHPFGQKVIWPLQTNHLRGSQITPLAKGVGKTINFSVREGATLK